MTNKHEMENGKIEESLNVFLTVFKEKGEWKLVNHSFKIDFDADSHTERVRGGQELGFEVVYAREVNFCNLNSVKAYAPVVGAYVSVVRNYISELGEEGTFESDELDRRTKSLRRKMKMIKVVLFCNASNKSMYGTDGYVHHELEKMAECKIIFMGFVGYLNDLIQVKFIKECEDADLVILDAWNYDEKKGMTVKNAQESMANIAAKIKTNNPAIIMFADLMEGYLEVEVHKYATPLPHWTSKVLKPALRYLRAKKSRKERR